MENNKLVVPLEILNERFYLSKNKRGDLLVKVSNIAYGDKRTMKQLKKL